MIDGSNQGGPHGDDEQGTGIVYVYATRSVRVYPVTEDQLELLAWLPWFARRRMIRNLRESCAFESGEQ